MKRSILIGLSAAAALLAVASAASADNLASLVGNTSVCTAPGGAVTKVYVQAGGAYTITLPDGQKVTGTAVDNGTTMTFTDANAAPGSTPVQTPSVSRKVGDTWEVTAQGATQKCVLAAGQQ